VILAMIINTKKDIPSSEITDPLIFKDRRKIIKAMLATMVAGTGISRVSADDNKSVWANLPKSDVIAEVLTPTPVELIKNYTNYYEFAFNKKIQRNWRKIWLPIFGL
jgi:hypothetical protein